MPQLEPVSHPDFDDFVATIAALRAPGGCPWDREQTHASIANNMLEEAYEAVDAIESNDIAHLREELGDVLLQVVLQSQIASDEGEFTIDDVACDVNAKMIRRHPHVFGDAAAQSANDVLSLWDQVKLEERASKNAESDEKPDGLLDGVPVSFPALMQAQKISRKAAAAGFEWDTVDDVWDQVNEEILELKEAYTACALHESGKIDKTQSGEAFHQAQLEFGDVLFSLVNVGRKMGINSEEALRETCRKFRARWSAMEQIAREEQRAIDSYSTEELNMLWQQVKKSKKLQ